MGTFGLFDDDRNQGTTKVGRNAFMCEGVLWTNWIHRGSLFGDENGVVMKLFEDKFNHIVMAYGDVVGDLLLYARDWYELAIQTEQQGGELSDISSEQIEPVVELVRKTFST